MAGGNSIKIAVHSPFTKEVAAALSPLPGVTVALAPTPADLPAMLDGAEVFVTGSMLYDEPVAKAVANAGQLKWIQFASSGVDPLLDYPAPPGVVVTNGAPVWAPSVAEHAIAMLIGLQRQLPFLEKARRAGEWTQAAMRTRLRSLDGATILLVGFGEIGQEIAKRLKAFGPRLIAVARSTRTHPDVESVVPVEELDALLPTADAVILAVPLSSVTHHLIDARRLGLLKADAVLINMARGPVIDEVAVEAALREGRLRAAGLDVFDTEPLSADSPLWKLDNLILSPHVAGTGNPGARKRLVTLCLENVRRWRAGEPLIHVVPPELLTRD